MTDWKECPDPGDVTLTGRFFRVELYRLAKHIDDLYAAYSQGDGRDWTYLFDGPFETAEEYYKFSFICKNDTDRRHYAVEDLATSKAIGGMSLTRIDK